MNREERRKYRKYLDSNFKGLSEETKQTLVERRGIIESKSLVPLYEGDKVVLNFNRITSYPDYKNMRLEYRTFIEENAIKEFTVEYNPTGKEADKNYLVQLLEDTSEIKFLFHTIDLIVVKRADKKETELEAHVRKIEEAWKGMN